MIETTMSYKQLWLIMANIYIAASFCAETPKNFVLIFVGAMWIFLSWKLNQAEKR